MANTIDTSAAGQQPSGNFIAAILRGAAQVVFQGKAFSGLLILVAIFWGAYAEHQHLVAWGALTGLLVSTATGYVLGLPRKDGEQGLWGFNGILVGCGFMTFLGNTPFSWLGLILCAALTTWVRTGFNNIMKPWKVNSFTFPFVFCTWLFLLAARFMQGMPPHYMSTPELPESIFSTSIDMSIGSLAVYWLKNISQIYLLNSWVAGAIILLALLVGNRWSAFWAAVASAIALVVIIAFKGNGADIAEGLYGFSPVLTGIALGSVFYKVNWRSALWCILGIIVTVFVQAAVNVFLTPTGIPALTGPFCIATWLFLLPLIKFDKKSKEDEDHTSWEHHKSKPTE